MTREKMASARQAVYYRNYRRARDRALSRLAQAYPDDYKEYLEEERANDEQLGKNWIAGNTTISVTILGTRAEPAATGSQAADGGENEGDRGGEA